MYHEIQFRTKVVVDVRVPGRSRLERLVVQDGTTIRAEIQPFVEESADGPVESANLYLEDGTTLLGIPMAWFQFPD